MAMAFLSSALMIIGGILIIVQVALTATTFTGGDYFKVIGGSVIIIAGFARLIYDMNKMHKDKQE